MSSTSRQRARQRLRNFDARSLSHEELLGLLLRGPYAQERAQEILQGGLVGLMQPAPRAEFGEANMVIVLAVAELARRLARLRIPQRRLLDRTDLVADYLYLRYHDPDHEILGALYLDCTNRLLAEGEVYRGTQHRSAVEPRGILKPALLHSASAMVLFHTHPSGCPAPSAEDLGFTRQMAAAGELIGIRLLDHIILGDAGRWVSLKKRGTW
jgi:DNA repair protein RadC